MERCCSTPPYALLLRCLPACLPIYCYAMPSTTFIANSRTEPARQGVLRCVEGSGPRPIFKFYTDHRLRAIYTIRCRETARARSFLCFCVTNSLEVSISRRYLIRKGVNLSSCPVGVNGGLHLSRITDVSSTDSKGHSLLRGHGGENWFRGPNPTVI